jgi:hypothetical protein
LGFFQLPVVGLERRLVLRRRRLQSFNGPLSFVGSLFEGRDGLLRLGQLTL